MYRSPTLKDTLSRLAGIQYLPLTDASLGYHNLILHEQSLHITTYSCLFCSYTYIWLPFGAVPVGDIFQKKIDGLFNEMPNVFGTAGDILIVGSDELERVHGQHYTRCQEYADKQTWSTTKINVFSGVPASFSSVK